jgi:hypothetical protein
MTTEERVEKLEKELVGAKRRSRVMLVAVAMTVAGMFLLCAGNGVQKSVRAQSFELVDQNGKTLAALETRENGTGLTILDQNGNDRVTLQLDNEEMPGVVLFDKNGKARVQMSVGTDGAPGLGLLDQDGTVRVAQLLKADGTSALGLFDQNGEIRAGLAMDALGTPRLSVIDQTGKAIWHAP